MGNQANPSQPNPGTPQQPAQPQNAAGVSDDQFAEQLAATLLNEHKATGAQRGTQAGPHANQLGDLFKKLRAAGIPWVQILALVPSIIQLITTGTGDWNALLAAIFALFGKQPTP